jgi:hypothetical protein
MAEGKSLDNDLDLNYESIKKFLYNNKFFIFFT